MIILHHQTYILVAVLRFVLCLWRRFFSYLLCLLMRPLAGAVSGAVEEKKLVQLSLGVWPLFGVTYF